MDVKLHLSSKISTTTIPITGSKSETNRLLLLQALYPGITIFNASESDDSKLMREALRTDSGIIDIHHAGTAMRFLTAYFALQEGREIVLTGSQRMKERPIEILVDALRKLGAKIEYLENEGYPPLKIIGQKLTGENVAIKADVSSQYLTALILVGAGLEKGLELTLQGVITSMSYLEMTIGLLKQVGIKVTINDNVISVEKLTVNPVPVSITVESDWSSASYYYSIAALAEEGTEIKLSSYKQYSLQGDSALSNIYKNFGVVTKFENDTITLYKTNFKPEALDIDLNNTPDIAQTIAVTCFGLGIACTLTGLHTLKIKETDRLAALKTELEKLGGNVAITEDSLKLDANLVSLSNLIQPVNTYNDHRMAMAFAPLAVKAPIIINDADVVSKSYPAFWEDLQKLGFVVNK